MVAMDWAVCRSGLIGSAAWLEGLLLLGQSDAGSDRASSLAGKGLLPSGQTVLFG
ncbi:MAG: hypothetical protein HC871_00005 [Rhizobiales bacterium]|nr:hypothetical protein [Hyphomicrobiales bacterium]